MRRLLAIPPLALAAAALLVAAGGGESGYRVDAIFDRTAALIPGQEVRVAGAKVGDVVDIELTADRRARVQMEVFAPGFAPFHGDATCSIRQDALLGEKFVECQPGTVRAAELEDEDGQAPTVPLERTTTPVEIDTVLSTFRLPYRQRLRILLNELGYGLAGRGDDLNELIRRANPALKEANDLLRELARERERLGRLVEGTDAAVAELADRRSEVQGLVERADEVTRVTAGRRGDIEPAIRRLPPLLDELEPSARRLGSFAREATPAVRELRSAAPALERLLGDFDPLSRAAVPALERLELTSRTGRRAVRVARPVARLLRAAARRLPAPVRTATELVESMRDQGALEGTLRFGYYATAAQARFDAVSHILPSYQVVGPCNVYATEPVPGCSARFAGASAAGQRARRARVRRVRRAGGGRSRGAPPRAPRIPAQDQAPSDSPSSDPAPGPPGPPLEGPQADPGDNGIPLLDWLLGP